MMERSGLKRRCRREIHWHLGRAMQVVGDRLVTNHDNCVDQMARRPACSEEGIDQRGIGMATLNGDAAHQASQGIELGIERSAPLADLDDLLRREAHHAANDCVGGQAVFATVDLTDHQVDNLPGLTGDAALGVLQSEVTAQGRFGMGQRRVQVGHYAQAMLELVKQGVDSSAKLSQCSR